MVCSVLSGVGGRRWRWAGSWGLLVGLVLGVALVIAAAPDGVAGWHTAHVVSRGSGSVTPIAAATNTASALTPDRGASAALPAAAQAPVSAIVGRSGQAYRALASGHDYVLRNGGQRLRGFFGTSGAVFSSGAARLGMRLTSYGYRDRLRAVAATRPRADANRVVYRHRGLVQWYENGPLGIDQGFTLPRPPVDGARGDVTCRSRCRAIWMRRCLAAAWCSPAVECHSRTAGWSPPMRVGGGCRPACTCAPTGWS